MKTEKYLFNMLDEFIEESKPMHKTFHKFEKWLIKTYGKDYHSKLIGFEVIKNIEKYIKSYCPEIKIIPCDDAEYGSSIILLIHSSLKTWYNLYFYPTKCRNSKPIFSIFLSF